MSPAHADCAPCSAEELAALALAGHGPAWDEAVRRHTHRVVVALLARGVPLEAAEDLAQEAWIRLVEQQRAGRLQALQLPGLAIAQACWLAREAGRTQARRAALVNCDGGLAAARADPADHDPAADPERRTMQRERLELVQRELDRCPVRSREVFRAVYAERAPSHTEVARELGLSVQRVRQILCEVRARVRAALDNMERQDERWHT